MSTEVRVRTGLTAVASEDSYKRIIKSQLKLELVAVTSFEVFFFFSLRMSTLTKAATAFWILWCF